MSMSRVRHVPVGTCTCIIEIKWNELSVVHYM